jgi:hypothetical protein
MNFYKRHLGLPQENVAPQPAQARCVTENLTPCNDGLIQTVDDVLNEFFVLTLQRTCLT